MSQCAYLTPTQKHLYQQIEIKYTCGWHWVPWPHPWWTRRTCGWAWRAAALAAKWAPATTPRPGSAALCWAGGAAGLGGAACSFPTAPAARPGCTLQPSLLPRLPSSSCWAPVLVGALRAAAGRFSWCFEVAGVPLELVVIGGGRLKCCCCDQERQSLMIQVLMRPRQCFQRCLRSVSWMQRFPFYLFVQFR